MTARVKKDKALVHPNVGVPASTRAAVTTREADRLVGAGVAG